MAKKKSKGKFDSLVKGIESGGAATIANAKNIAGKSTKIAKKTQQNVAKSIEAGGAAIVETAKIIAGQSAEIAKITQQTVAKGMEAGGAVTVETAKGIASQSTEIAKITQQTVINTLDQDGNGLIDTTDLILISLKVPGVKINRDDFLRKELFKNHPKEIIDIAIEQTPAIAGIPSDEINKIADDVIILERYTVSGISTALGLPGGAAMAATIPADIAQYYGCMLRVAQKLLYLYGFPELNVSDDGVVLDSETLNSLTLCLGVMYGVANANNAIKAMAKALAAGVEKELLKKALTKGTIYPIVKSVAKWFGVRMTKQIFAGVFKKSIPVIGGVIGGGLTFATFKPCCDQLKNVLSDTLLSNPDHVSDNDESIIVTHIMDGTTIDIVEDEAECYQSQV